MTLELFLDELTALSRARGIGIAGAPILFIMEDEDIDRSYKEDDTGKLLFD